MTSEAYYNENDAFCADWLENLIDAGEIAPGKVDRRSILDVTPADLRGFTQHHFFAGIGIWSYALREAGWPDDRKVWTGSCPCQPFSAAGKGKGFADERHLWPAWDWLIGQQRPDIIFGEQVATTDGLTWFDLVSTDLEGKNYAIGANDLSAAGFGAPEVRQRLYFVADTDNAFRRSTQPRGNIRNGTPPRWQESNRHPSSHLPSILPHGGFWAGATAALGTDGLFRGLESGTFPLAYVHPTTMGLLRAYGNAIVAEQAIEFITAYLNEELDDL